MKGIIPFLFPSFMDTNTQVGDIYCLDSDVDNPFQEDKLEIRITGVRDGWVRYDYVGLRPVGRTMKISNLNWLYTKVRHED